MMEASRSSIERGKWSQKRSVSKVCPACQGHGKLGAGQIDKKGRTCILLDKADHLSLLQQASQYQEDKFMLSSSLVFAMSTMADDETLQKTSVEQMMSSDNY
ncbi:zinc finger, RING-type [Musa troglodytarum]|uniref:Zinc finger, RING-type n=1 Tax=Musa troglodytarum TaxID=320322 RepID=A0A9E7I8G2_9LILI|nr:zinc finger, RING-type [Musa troglodytarum]